jgi:uncharacterized membrane protein (DUF106 family)
MRALFGEPGHVVVIELGRALLRPVAFGAVLAQFAPVLVIFLMAVIAAVLIQLVLVLPVARFARQGPVLAF